MDIFNLFINFINQILSFKIFDVKLSTYLLTITLVSMIFLIIKNISSSKK